MTSKENIDFLEKILKYFFLPLFICNILAVDYLCMCNMYRQALTIIFIVFSINALCWNKRRITK